MTAQPAISIITPTYNRRVELARAVRSVQQQTFTDYEHIIVDDGSQDGTERFVRDLDDPRIHYVRFATRRGANAARNAGIEQARSEWITFLDSDDEFLCHRLASTALWQSPACPLLVSSFHTMKRGKRRLAVNPQTWLSQRELEESLMTHSVFIAGSSITVRRQTLREAGAFNEQLGRMQDRDALLRLARHTGAQLLGEVDWIKHPSRDSISGAAHGYVEALGALAAAHPGLARRYRDVIAYHVARRVLSELLGLRLGRARRSLMENYSAGALGFSARELVRGYRSGAAWRRQCKVGLVRVAWTYSVRNELLSRVLSANATTSS